MGKFFDNVDPRLEAGLIYGGIGSLAGSGIMALALRSNGRTANRLKDALYRYKFKRPKLDRMGYKTFGVLAAGAGGGVLGGSAGVASELDYSQVRNDLNKNYNYIRRKING